MSDNNDTIDLPTVSQLELVQMLASQHVVLDHDELHDEYREKVYELCEKYDVEYPDHYDDPTHE